MTKDNYLKIQIATDFSKYPGARYRADGDNSGQKFYEDILSPKLHEIWDKPNKKILLDLDGTFGYASSFISEIFTRLVKEFRDTKRIKQKIEYKSDDEPLLINSILRVIDETKTDETKV